MDDFLDVAMVGTDCLRKKGSKSRYKIDSTSDLIENRSGKQYDCKFKSYHSMNIHNN